MFMNTSSTPERCAAALSWCTGVKSREASAVLTIRLVVSGTSSPGSSCPTFTCWKRTLCMAMLAPVSADAPEDRQLVARLHLLDRAPRGPGDPDPLRARLHE